MTISSSTNKAGPFITPGTGPFAFTFKTFLDTDLRAIHVSSAGVETELELTTDFTISLNADQEADPGGELTLGEALTSGEKLYIVREVEVTQTLQLTTGGGFFPEAIMNALDRQAMIAQQLTEQIDRSLKATIGSGGDPSSLIEDITNAEAACSGYAVTAEAAAAEAEASAASIDPDLLAHIDVSGVNDDIKELTGLTTPLSAGQGGTGQATLAAAVQGLLDAIGNTAGDMLIRGADDWAVLAKGTALQQLRMNSGATAPEWAAPGSLLGIYGRFTSGSSLTATRPAGATKALIRVQGGGGAGAYAAITGGAGGGSGAFAEAYKTVSGDLTVTVGGATVASSVAGDGFTTITAAGGGNASGSTPGTGGTLPTTGDINLAGQAGAFNGGGGGGLYAQGGGGNGTLAGTAGLYGGGGGAGGMDSGGSYPGGAGGAGFVTIYWYA